MTTKLKFSREMWNSQQTRRYVGVARIVGRCTETEMCSVRKEVQRAQSNCRKKKRLFHRLRTQSTVFWMEMRKRAPNTSRSWTVHGCLRVVQSLYGVKWLDVTEASKRVRRFESIWKSKWQTLHNRCVLLHSHPSIRKTPHRVLHGRNKAQQWSEIMVHAAKCE